MPALTAEDMRVVRDRQRTELLVQFATGARRQWFSNYERHLLREGLQEMLPGIDITRAFPQLKHHPWGG